MKHCSYMIPTPFRTDRNCLNAAKWLVEFTTPDDGKTMRRRALVFRCYWHRDARFLPKGATQVVTSAIETVEQIRAVVGRMDGAGATAP